jgi:hypothetical protein
MAEISYRRHRFPPVIIQHAVWLYLRFTLGVGDRWLGGLLFRREERLGRPARGRDPLAIMTAKVGLLLPVVEQGLPRLFDYSRHRSGVREFVNLRESL